MGASPKTTSFLKECMADALLYLMKEKPFAKITVNEIARTAGVNRSTWFRNFATKTEALTFKLMVLWYRWAADHGMTEYHRYTVDNADLFFSFNASVRDMLSLIYQAELQACVYDAFYQIMKPQYGDDPVECCEARFYSYVLDEWIKRGFYETPEQLTALFREVGRDVGRREPPTSACYFRKKGLQWSHKTMIRREITYGS